MDLQALTNTRFAHGLARTAGRTLPPSLGERVARTAARRMTAASARIASAVRVNQWMASGGTLTGAALDGAVEETIAFMGRYVYDLYHVMGDDAAEDAAVILDETFERYLELQRVGPVVYATCHLGNFDLCGRVLARHGWRVQILSIPDPNEGYRAQNALRVRAGLEVTPVSVEALRLAERRLASGGSVVTGLDRPLPDSRYQPRFFGRPAPLPALHVRLARRADVPVVVVGTLRGDDGRYRLLASDPVRMIQSRGDDGHDSITHDVERLLALAEEMILSAPRQWAMPHVVWPDVTLDEIVGTKTSRGAR